MICPGCRYDNVSGTDTCEGCGGDLTTFDVPRGGTPLEKSVVQTPISKVDAPPMITVEPTTAVSEVVERLVRGNVGCVLVVANDDLIGIFSERDLLLKVGDRYEELKSRPIRDFMTPDPETLKPDATIAFALNRADVGGFRHLPIVRDGRPEAVVSVRDLMCYLAEHWTQESGRVG